MKRQSRREFIKTLGKTLGTLGLCPAIAGCQFSSEQTVEQKPNFVFILADDLGWVDLACYGHKFHETPNLDKLASEGMLFTNAYAASPVCSPTRATLTVGLSPTMMMAGSSSGQ